MKQTLLKNICTQRWGYFFILPAFILFICFVLIPFMNAVRLGFHEYEMGHLVFRGLKNYLDLFRDDVFIKSVLNTLKYVLILVPLEIGLALFIAVTLYRRSGGVITFFRGVFYLPVVIPSVCMALVWRWMYNPTYGILNSILGLLGIPAVDFLGQPSTAIYALMAVIMMYGIGQPLVLYIAALNGIPKELIEAAEIDGAGPFTKFRRIILPLLMPVTLYNMVIQTIAVIQVIEVVLLLTGGGPSYTTSSMLFLIWNYAFHLGKLGHAAAIGNIMFIIVAILSLLQFRFLRTRADY